MRLRNVNLQRKQKQNSFLLINKIWPNFKKWRSNKKLGLIALEKKPPCIFIQSKGKVDRKIGIKESLSYITCKTKLIQQNISREKGKKLSLRQKEACLDSKFLYETESESKTIWHVQPPKQEQQQGVPISRDWKAAMRLHSISFNFTLLSS